MIDVKETHGIKGVDMMKFIKVDMPTCDMCGSLNKDIYELQINHSDDEGIRFCRPCLNLFSTTIETTLNAS